VPRGPAKAGLWMKSTAKLGEIDACFELALMCAADLTSEGNFVKAFHLLKRAAEAGHARAAQELEILVSRGIETLEGLTFLSEQGDPNAHFHLGLLYAADIESKGNFVKAFDLLKRAAEAGHPRAAQELEILKLRGADTLEGLTFLSEQEDPNAQFHLGMVYAARLDTKGSLYRAFDLLQRAAKAGHARAALELEILRSRGSETLEGLTFLSEQGDPNAQFQLGLMYAADLETNGNFHRAFDLLERAAKAGHARAAQELEILRQRGIDILEGLTCLAEQGETSAQLKLARNFATGTGVNVDSDLAVRWLWRAARAGDPEAAYHLGVARAVGAGVPRNRVEARMWLERAAAGGHPDARAELNFFGPCDQDSKARSGTQPTPASSPVRPATTTARVISRFDSSQLVVLGNGAFAFRFASILRRHGLPVIECDTSPPSVHASVTLFVTDGLIFTPTGEISCDFARYFDAIRDAATRFPRALLRHPVFAHELIGFHYAESAALFGFPGSGNTVFMKVVEELQRMAQCRLSRDQNFFRDLARLHVAFLVFALQRTVPALTNWTLIPSNQRLGVMDMACVSEFAEANVPRRLRPGLVGRLFDLATINHAASCFVSHGFDEAGLQRLKDLGFTCFLLVRNPLDAIHSLLSKYDGPLGPIVQDCEAFDLLVQGLVTYLARVSSCASRHSLLKYEMLLSHFDAQATAVADKLNLQCDRGHLVRLKQDLLFKNLVGDPTHFRGGESGRWKMVLDRRHFDILCQRGFFDVMAALNYAPPTREEFRTEPIVGEATSSLRWDLYFFHHLVDVPLPSASEPAYDSLDDTHIAFHIEDEWVRRQLKTQLETRFGHVLLNLVT
jgi:TPR repeat protein